MTDKFDLAGLLMNEHRYRIGHIVIFLANIFSNEVIFKKMIRDLLTNFKSEFDLFLNEAVEHFNLDTYAKLKYTRDNYKMNNEVYNKSRTLQEAEQVMQELCFDNIVMKSLSIIFSKLIIISDSDNKFKFKNEINKFFVNNVSNFIDSFNNSLNYDFIEGFNRKLKEDPDNQASSLTESSHYSSRIIRENAINLKNSEKPITLDDDMYYLSVYNSLQSLNYSLNYWIDLKELYMSMKIRNYNIEMFIEYLPIFVEHNLELSLFDAKLQAMRSICYLIGLCFSIGHSNAFLTTV